MAFTGKSNRIKRVELIIWVFPLYKEILIMLIIWVLLISLLFQLSGYFFLINLLYIYYVN
jgi:hypothetical protein